jgi:hypothetical protein
MCLSHGMRRRTGRDGGYRAIVFLDSIDKLKRLHGDYQDAEEARRLAALRTRLFDDDPGTRQPRRECCGQPATCDRFREGECWYFAATDGDQIVARGRYGFSLLHWLPPKSGRTPWLSDEVYGGSVGFTIPPLELGSEALLRELPLEAPEEVGLDIHPKICRPGGVTLEVAGKMPGAGWTAHWHSVAEQRAVRRIGATKPDNRLKVTPSPAELWRFH